MSEEQHNAAIIDAVYDETGAKDSGDRTTATPQDGALVAELREVRALFRDLPQEQPSPSVSAALLAAAARPARTSGGLRRWFGSLVDGIGTIGRHPAALGLTTLVVAVGVAGALYYRGGRPAQPEVATQATPPTSGVVSRGGSSPQDIRSLAESGGSIAQEGPGQPVAEPKEELRKQDGFDVVLSPAAKQGERNRWSVEKPATKTPLPKKLSSPSKDKSRAIYARKKQRRAGKKSELKNTFADQERLNKQERKAPNSPAEPKTAATTGKDLAAVKADDQVVAGAVGDTVVADDAGEGAAGRPWGQTQAQKVAVAAKKRDCAAVATLTNDLREREPRYYDKKLRGIVSPCSGHINKERKRRVAVRRAKKTAPKSSPGQATKQDNDESATSED